MELFALSLQSFSLIYRHYFMLYRKRLFLFFGLLAPVVLIAQSPVAQLPGTNVERLLEMAREFRSQEIRERAEAEAFAREHGLPIRLEDSL
jgi:hypothetical protein